MDSSIHTVIVGAGPYGLSLAAHLAEKGVPFRIFGRAMEAWATQMPRGMKLKSDGIASDLFAGSVSWTLRDFCLETGRLYHPTLHPVALEDFVAYGEEFARRFVPALETRTVILVEPVPLPSASEFARESHSPGRLPARFRVALDDGEVLHACEVVLAVGLAPFPFIPHDLCHLPADMVSHTSDHRTFDEFRAREVTVLGRGASALNAAALLNEAGARTTLISRKPKLHIHLAARRHGRSLYQRLRHPYSPLGPGLRSWLCSHFPMLFHALPGFLRRGLVYKHLGPSGGSSLRGRIKGHVPLLMGWKIASAEMLSAGPADRHIHLSLVNEDGEVREHVTSHIIAGTGFRVDVQRLHVLAPPLLAALRTEPNGAPRLDRRFGSSVPGLYFVGPAAAASFGQLLRFAAGARFASARLSAHLARSYHRTLRRGPSQALEPAQAPARRAA